MHASLALEYVRTAFLVRLLAKLVYKAIRLVFWTAILSCAGCWHTWRTTEKRDIVIAVAFPPVGSPIARVALYVRMAYILQNLVM